MLYANRHQFEADVRLLQAVAGRLLSGTGLTANVPDLPICHKNNFPAKKSKEVLKHETALQLAKQLNRPDFLNYIKL